MIAIPTNKPMQRLNHPDVIYRSEREKFVAIADEIETDQQVGRAGNDRRHGARRHDRQGDRRRRSNSQPRNAARRKRSRATRSATSSAAAGRCWSAPCRSKRASGSRSCWKSRGIKHEVLNAKHHKREAEIVAQAGRLGAVTIATNMAGRGTDIILGGNPETMAWAQLQDKYPTRLDVPQEEWNTLVDRSKSASR